eukprot:gnl/TRDRNA2_/TRDRNA2_147143_c0_seq2.p1 gnl/TRDRNA2_/TRDRNA2_147143_c0~~gnl/TRDRNA2_/TRDRNA2_147143_c0_seq2.p1  ORF type:complete len:303 (+),score=37.18 gnl/TRDRNA2_/TRDRNA2_147143_c0_seq2:122-1030(+)
MLAPDGTHIANVDHQKAEWYLSRGLGVRISENPFAFQLFSAPQGMGHAGDEFYLQDRLNCCVGCGTGDRLVRFYVVPHSFRRLLPQHLKEHESHDIVLLCVRCFTVASQAVSRHRKQILVQSGISDNTSHRLVVEVDKDRARKAANALLQPRLPEDVRKQKLATVCAYLGIDAAGELTDVAVRELAKKVTRTVAEDYVSPEVAFMTKEGLSQGADYKERCFRFIVGWRQAFVDALKPAHLPHKWDVHRKLVSQSTDLLARRVECCSSGFAVLVSLLFAVAGLERCCAFERPMQELHRPLICT